MIERYPGEELNKLTRAITHEEVDKQLRRKAKGGCADILHMADGTVEVAQNIPGRMRGQEELKE